MNKRPFSFVVLVIIILAGVFSVYASPLPPPTDEVKAPALNPVRVERPFFPHTPEISGQTAVPTTEWTLHKTADGVHPDDNEQEMVWLMNHARANPTAEGIWLATSAEPDIANDRDYFGVDVALLQSEFASYSVKPPAAFDQRLYNAAQAHSEYLISINDQTQEGQEQRIADAGFSYISVRGNVFSYSRNPLYAHAAFNIDWGGNDGTGMQTGRGHRMAIMSIDGDYTNVGIAMAPNTVPTNTIGPLVTTGNYAEADTGEPDHYNRFIVGTVWDDLDGNGRYGAGEGRGGVTVMPDNGIYYAITGDSGGYAIPVDAGSYQITFSGGGIATAQQAITVGTDSVLLDHISTYELTGRVERLDNGTGIAGVRMETDGGQTAVSDSNGDYTFTNLLAGSYTITPQTGGYGYTPASVAGTVPPDGTVATIQATVSPVYLPVIMKPLNLIDLAVTGLEVTQVVQRTDNSVPLVANKETAVRVYAQQLAGDAVNDVIVQLTAVRNSSTIGTLSSIAMTLPSNPSRANFNSTINFELPASWLNGTVQLTAAIVHDGNDGNPDNNSQNYTMNFNNVPALDVKIVPINYTHEGAINPGYYPGSAIDHISDWIERAYPVGDVNISYHAPYAFTGNLDDGDDWGRLLDEITDLKDADGASSATVYYASIPISNGSTQWFYSGIAGLGWIGWRASVGLDLGYDDKDKSGTLAGHEIGHNLGRRHAPCGVDGEPDYPYPGGDIGQYGLDVRNWLFKTPATDYDIMSYCNPEWMSDYTYSALYVDQMAYGRPVLATMQESVLVRASLSADDIVIRPTYELNTIPSTLPANSLYAVELVNSDGAVFATYPLALLEAEEEGVHVLSLHAAIPADAAMASIRITHNGVQIGERAMSGQNKVAQTAVLQTAVSLTETATTITLQWGDLTTPAIIRYTADDGATWQTIAIDQVGGQFVIEKGEWLGENGRFELVFADGGGTAVKQR